MTKSLGDSENSNLLIEDPKPRSIDAYGLQLIFEEWRRILGDHRYQGMMPHCHSPGGDLYSIRRDGRNVILTVDPRRKIRDGAYNELIQARGKLAQMDRFITSLKSAIEQPCDPPEAERRQQEMTDAVATKAGIEADIKRCEAALEGTWVGKEFHVPNLTQEFVFSVDEINALRYAV